MGLPPWPEVVAEIHEKFLGHRLTAGNPRQTDARPTDRNLRSCNIIEPNAWGANAVRAAFWEALSHHLPAVDA